MKLIKYLKGKKIQLTTPKKEVYDGVSDKIGNSNSMKCLYANEVYKEGDANGFYIFRFTITKKQEDEIIILLTHLNACGLYFYKCDDDCGRYLYIYGTARNITKLIDKYMSNVYTQSSIITKTEVNNFLLYKSIYRCVYGNLDNFDTSIFLVGTHRNTDKKIYLLLNEITAETVDIVWANMTISYLLYDKDTNDFTIELEEDHKLKRYKDGDNILEEDYDEDSFDPSIDEII